jgi:hypothetical protein
MPNQARLGGGRQTASKIAHSAFVENPEIRAFLAECNYMREPNDDELKLIQSRFEVAPASDDAPPDFVIAIDGSPYESHFHKGLPSTRAGYFKVSGVAVSIPRYKAACDKGRRYLDPFAMAAIYEQRDALTFCLPSSNMEYRGATSVKHGFRLKLFEEFTAEKTRIVPGKGDTFLNTLFKIAGLLAATSAHGDDEDSGKPNGLSVGGIRYIRVHKCASCNLKPAGGFLVPEEPGYIKCSEASADGCSGTIFATDALRVHESVTTHGPNMEAISRTMNVVEALFMAHLILHLMENSPQALSRTCFVVDGPLALFGEAAWMHGGLLRLYHHAQDSLAKKGLPPFLLFGIQKTGQVAEHAAMLRPHLGRPGECLVMPVSDEYRAEHIRERDDNQRNFGDETYWGQDFLFRASNGDIFVMAVPYCTPTKRVADPEGVLDAEGYFRQIKSEVGRYPTLARTLEVIEIMRSDLYESSIVPVLAAHREASISLMPGGRVLDLMSLTSFSASSSAAISQ